MSNKSTPTLKNKQALEIKEYLENIISLMPGHVYWKDKNGVLLGCNDQQAKDAGLSSREDIVGKTDFDMPWREQAESLEPIHKPHLSLDLIDFDKIVANSLMEFSYNETKQKDSSKVVNFG